MGEREDTRGSRGNRYRQHLWVPNLLQLPLLDSEPATYELFLTIDEVAMRWRIHPNSLRRWRQLKPGFKRYGPPFVKITDGHVLYPLSGVLKYERENTFFANRPQRSLYDPGFHPQSDSVLERHKEAAGRERQRRRDVPVTRAGSGLPLDKRDGYNERDGTT